MGANSKFHKVLGAVEIVVGAILDYWSFGWVGNPLIAAGIATWQGTPNATKPAAAGQPATVNSAIAPLQIVYGEIKTSGILIAGDSGDGGAVGDADYKYVAVAHSMTLKTGAGTALPCDSAQGWWLDDTFISTGYLDGSGNVVAGDFSGLVSIKTYLGDQTTVDPWLHAGLSYWDSNAILHGICYTVFKIHADPNSDAFQKAFPNGLPRTYSVLLKGQKIYDPRLDSTAGGSGTHRKNDPTTWAWSDNPALIARDYLVRPTSESGGGIDYNIIPDDYLSAAANRCDDLMTVPNNAGGTTTIKRFTCNIGLDTSAQVDENFQHIKDCMAGWHIPTGADLRIFAGQYVAPVTTIDETWLSGEVSFPITTEHKSRWNTVTATFTDSDEPTGGLPLYAAVQTPAYAVAGAVTADGEVLPRDLQVPGVNNQYRAQYLTMISANQSQNHGQPTLQLNYKARDLDCGEIVAIDLPTVGINIPSARVIRWPRAQNGGYQVTFQIEAATTFDEGTFTETPPPGAPALTDTTPPTPTITVTALAEGFVVKITVPARKNTWVDAELSTSTDGGTTWSVYTNNMQGMSETVPYISGKVTLTCRLRLRNYRGTLGNWSAAQSATNKTYQDGATLGATIGPGGNVTGSVDANGRATIDFSQPGHFNKIIDYIGDGFYGRTLFSRLSSGKPWIDFSEGIHAHKNLDYIPDSAARFAAAEAGANRNPQGTLNVVPQPSPRDSSAWGWGAASANESVTAHTYGANTYAPVLGYFELDYIDNGRAYIMENGAIKKFQCTGGETLYFGGYFDVGTATDIEMFIFAYHADGSNSYAYTTPVTAAGWNPVFRTWQLPTDCVYFTVMIWGTITAGQKYYWDNILVAHHSRALTVAGSGAKIGDIRNLPLSNSSGYGLIRSATAWTGHSTGAVDVNAHTVTGGAWSTSYPAHTSAITGLATGSYYIYQRDNIAGGTSSPSYTTSAETANSFDDAYQYGVVSIPSSGTSSGGGSGIGPSCYDADMYLKDGLTCRQLVERWRWWHCLFPPVLDGPDGPVKVRRKPRIVHDVPRCRVIVDDRHAVKCSIGTPFNTFNAADSESQFAADLYAYVIDTDGGRRKVKDVVLIGYGDVVRISCGGRSFYAGESPFHRLGGHNTVKP